MSIIIDPVLFDKPAIPSLLIKDQKSGKNGSNAVRYLCRKGENDYIKALLQYRPGMHREHPEPETQE